MEGRLCGVTAADLRELPPLPKVHYSFPIGQLYLVPVHPVVAEYVRITHAITLNPHYHQAQHVANAVRLCQEINARKPQIPVTIAVSYSPYHQIPSDVTDFGQKHRDELGQIREILGALAVQIRQANGNTNSPVLVSMVILDCEQYLGNVPATQAAATRKYNDIYSLCKELFPGVPVEWYNRGQVSKVERPPNWDVKWNVYERFSLQEKGDALSCSLYCLPEIGYTREYYERTHQNAIAHGAPTHVWIALASGFRRNPDISAGIYFDMDWNFDPVYSWFVGHDANTRWDVNAVFFYPAPFDTRVPHWGEHFVAYVRGAGKLPLHTSPAGVR